MTELAFGDNPTLEELRKPKLAFGDNPVVPGAAPTPASAAPLINPSQPREALLVDRLGVRPALEAGGAMVGGVLGGGAGLSGGPLAPVTSPAGMIAGGALGAAAGRGLGNLAAEIERQVRAGRVKESLAEELEGIVASPEKFASNVARQGLDMIQAGATDLAFGTGFHTVGRLASGTFRFAGRITGVQSPEVQQVIRDAREGNLAVGAIDLDKPFFTSAGKVAGVLPIVGGPIRTQAGGKAIRASEEFLRTLDEISPAVDLPALGVSFTKAGKAALDARRSITNAQYKRMNDGLAAVGARLKISNRSEEIIPTESIISRARALLGQRGLLPRTAEGTEIGFPVSGDDKFTDALERFTNLPVRITVEQLTELQKNLNRAARARSGNQMAANEFRIITELNSATWDDLSRIELDGPEDEFVKAIVRKAKRSWVDLKSLEETAAAAKFKRVDRNFFAAGFEKPGSIEMDELADIFVSSPSTLRSPEFIENFERLVGPQNRKALARSVIERAANPQSGLAGARLSGAGDVQRGVTDVVTFDAAQFRKNLGLTSPEGLGSVLRKNKAALNRLLGGTGVSAERLDSFLRSVERTQTAPGVDPSAFLTRRVLLGAGLGAGAIGAAAVSQASGPIGVGVFILGARQFSKLISSPGGLKLLREGVEPNLTRQQTANLARRLSAFFPNEEAEIQEGQTQ